MKLVTPDTQYHAAFCEFVKQYEKIGETRYEKVDLSKEGFAQYVAQLIDFSLGKNLPPDRVQGHMFWLIEDDQILGAIRVRHYLNDALRERGGHIGYDIAPNFRRKGYGKIILKLALEEAKALGLKGPFLLTCDKDNIGSVKVIEANGGKLEKIMESIPPGTYICRYVIDV